MTRLLCSVLLVVFLLGSGGGVEEGPKDGVETMQVEEEQKDAEETLEVEENPTVTVNQGQVRGFRSVTSKGKNFFTFHNIPFAKQPMGELRFKKPEPGEAWEDVLDGTLPPEPCLQVIPPILDSQDSRAFGREDCLTLSVHTPVPSKTSAFLPVMVFIHGGAYSMGSYRDFLPHPLMENEVVLVQINYRLGVLGFLSTEDDVIPGNFGLHDQTTALRWIQKNIHNFGGDSLRVTLFGESAGGASIHLQILSHLSIGLFHRAILQSGTALCPWSMGGAFGRVAQYVGRNANCSTSEGSDALLTCLQKVDSKDLTLIAAKLQTWHMFPVLLGPRMDGDFLKKDPVILMKEQRHKKQSLIVGATKHDGAIFSLPLMANEFVRQALVENFSLMGPLILEFSEGDVSPLNQSIHIFDHYLGGLKIDQHTAQDFTRMLTDRHTAICSDVTASMHAAAIAQTKKKVYLYELQTRPTRSMWDKFDMPFAKEWVTHGDDLAFLFHQPSLLPEMKDPNDLRMRELLTSMWFNFAAFGDPTPDDSLGFEWTPATAGKLSHLALKNEPSMEKDGRTEVREFWASIPTRQNMILNPIKVKKFVEIQNEKVAHAGTPAGASAETPAAAPVFKPDKKIERGNKVNKKIKVEKDTRKEINKDEL